jgi:hypothetical protein
LDDALVGFKPGIVHHEFWLPAHCGPEWRAP